MRVRALKDFRDSTKVVHGPGDILDVPEEYGTDLVRLGLAEPMTAREKPRPEPAPEPEPDEPDEDAPPDPAPQGAAQRGRKRRAA